MVRALASTIDTSRQVQEMTVLLTGAAGFIGYHVAERLLGAGETVIGVDNLNSYYDVSLKRARLARLRQHNGFTFYHLDIADPEPMTDLFDRHADIDRVIHLAAQAGVRYSLINPLAYVEANIKGQVVLLEAARRQKMLRSFVYASSSSVYGANKHQPHSVDDRVDHPVSLYAASKRAGELITESYCRIYGMSCTGLRFFTVYGPWGRPDMACYLFTQAILAGRPIDVYNEGRMSRDFTYVDDIASGVVAAADRMPGEPGEHRIYNLGNHRPEALLEFIAVIERTLGRSAIKNMLPMQPGDVTSTYADIELARRELGFEPVTPISVGLPRFIDWYLAYHGLEKAG
jgi:UDP-glucuronate 4-epimerase